MREKYSPMDAVIGRTACFVLSGEGVLQHLTPAKGH
jgi:hypothetical protein